MARTILLSHADHVRLSRLVESEFACAIGPQRCLDELAKTLAQAKVVAEEAIPINVVTMNATVQLVDVDSGERLLYTLVYPERADIGHGRLSVLAPIGSAILGCRVGEGVEWNVAGRSRRLCIDKVAQPQEDAALYSPVNLY